MILTLPTEKTPATELSTSKLDNMPLTRVAVSEDAVAQEVAQPDSVDKERLFVKLSPPDVVGSEMTMTTRDERVAARALTAQHRLDKVRSIR